MVKVIISAYRRMRHTLKCMSVFLDLASLDRLFGFVIYKKQFEPDIRLSKSVANRDELFKVLIGEVSNDPIAYFEFGVFKGENLSFVTTLNNCPSSVFVGFDSFRGLPKDWKGGVRRGSFNLNGKACSIDDSRVQIVTGRIEDRLPKFDVDGIVDGRRCIVFVDTDLFEPALVVLLEMHRRSLPWVLVFDQFCGCESHALYKFLEITGSRVEWIGRVGPAASWEPVAQVCCKVFPANWS